MATSDDPAFTLTARDIITRAMQACRITAIGEQPDAAEIEVGRVVLTSMLKSLQTQGVTWGLGRGVVTLNANESSGTLPPQVRIIESARIVATNYDRELSQFTRADYLSLPNKAAKGNPSVFYVDRQRDGAEIHVWPIPMTETQIAVDYSRSLDSITDVSETIDVPEEWVEAIWTNLALRLSTEFGAEIPAELSRRADSLMAQLLDSSRPESYNLAGWYA